MNKTCKKRAPDPTEGSAALNVILPGKTAPPQTG